MRRLPGAVLALVVAACGSGTPTAPSAIPLTAGSYTMSLSGSTQFCPALAILPRGLLTLVPLNVTLESGIAVGRPATPNGGNFELRVETLPAVGAVGTPISGSFSGQLSGITFGEFGSSPIPVQVSGTSAVDGIAIAGLTSGTFRSALSLTVGQQPIACPASGLRWTILRE